MYTRVHVSLSKYINTHMCVYRERIERERETYVGVCIYIYIYDNFREHLPEEIIGKQSWVIWVEQHFREVLVSTPSKATRGRLQQLFLLYIRAISNAII